MLCVALRPQEPLPSGPEYGLCIAYRPMAGRAVCLSRRATTWPQESLRRSMDCRASLRGLAFQSFRSQWRKAKWPRINWTTPTKPLAVFAALVASPVTSEGFVLSMQADGQLATKAPQSGFAQSYVDGVGANPPKLIVFAAPESEVPRTAPRPTPAIPRPEILAALQSTAHRYGGHPALRHAGLSVSEWLTLFQANIEIESAYRPNALSSVGAIGLGQLMPATAAQLGVDPHDWQANLDGSARYLLAMLARFGIPELALAAYNAGPDAVTRYRGIPPYFEAQNHVRRVMAVAQRLTGAS